MRRFAAVPLLSAFLLCACENGTVTLSVADAPVDGANHAQIRFTAIDLVETDGSKHTFDLDPDKTVDLLSSATSTTLLSSVTLPAGDYTGVTLHISADGSGSDSVLTYPATATSTQQQFALKLSDTDANADGIEVPASFSVTRLRNTAITADIDLRRSIIDANGGNPLVLDLGGSLTNNTDATNVRVVVNEDVGALKGNVAAALVNSSSNCSPAAVYVYRDNVDAPDDVGSANAPFSTTTLPTVTSSSASVSYSVNFLPEGTYTVALMCRADQDDPTKDDNIAVIDSRQDVQVTAGGITTVTSF